MSALPSAALAVALAAALDWLVREPPERSHPVAWFGRAVGALDREWRSPTAVGAGAALALPALAAAAVGLTVGVAAWLHPVAGTLVAALALFATTSLRSLLAAVDGVLTAAETDLDAARERLPALVGRDPEALDADHVRSAAIESAAENLSDGLVAPLLAFAVASSLATLAAPSSSAAATLGASAPLDSGASLGSSAALGSGAAAAAWIKAVNTMDSMLGYPEKRIGTAAALLDDVAMWLPARLSAVLLSVAAGSPDPVLAARRWAGATASPNAGWPMGTLAGAVGVRLEKPGAYDLNAVAPFPDADAARRGLRVVGRAGLLAYALAALAGVLAWAW